MVTDQEPEDTSKNGEMIRRGNSEYKVYLETKCLHLFILIYNTNWKTLNFDGKNAENDME